MTLEEFQIVAYRYAVSKGWTVQYCAVEAWFLKDGKDIAQAYLESETPVGIPISFLYPDQLVSVLRELIRTEIFLPDHPQRQAAFTQARAILTCSAPLAPSTVPNDGETAPAADNSGSTFNNCSCKAPGGYPHEPDCDEARQYEARDYFRDGDS